MIISNKPLSMAESLKYVQHEEEDSKTGVKGFIKKFVKISTKDAEEMRKKLEELDILKMKDEHIAKIIDLLPEDSEDLNKIFSDISLDEDESNKILEIIKQYK